MSENQLTAVHRFESFSSSSRAKQPDSIQRRTYAFWGAWSVILVSAVVSLSLILVVLFEKSAQHAGLVTLKINTSIPIQLSQFSREYARDFPGEGILQSLSGEIASAATAVDGSIGSAATAAHGVESAIASVVQTAEAGAATAIENATQTFIDKNVPQNISIGTKRLCLGYHNGTLNCDSLPVNISQILPTAFSQILGSETQILQQLEDDLVEKILGILRGSLSSGIVSIFVLVAMFLCLPRFLSFLLVWIRLLIALFFGMICLTPPILFTVIVSLIQKKVTEVVNGSLSSFLHIQAGEVGKYVLGALCGMVVMLVAGIVTFFL